MTLTLFNHKLMRFLYFLATNQKKMNSMSVHDELNKNGVRISDRTVRRWFKLMNARRDINYFLSLRCERLNLRQLYVLADGVRSEKLFGIIPFRTYGIKGLALNSLDQVRLTQYHIPSNRIMEFYSFWKTAKKRGLIKNYKIFPHKTSITFYSPFHEILGEDGYIRFKKEFESPPYFMNLYDKLTSQMNNQNDSSLIKKHPMIIPLLYSLFGENFSSKRMWHELKKHSESIWDFVPSKLLRKGRRDGAAIKYVQSMLKFIEQNEDRIYQQIRVSYKHFYQGNHNTFYLLIKIKNPSLWRKLIAELHKRTLQLNYTPFCANNMGMFYIVTNEKKFLEIMYDVVPHFSDGSDQNRIILQESDPEKNYYGHLDWTMFNPKTKNWIYANREYISRLNSLKSDRT